MSLIHPHRATRVSATRRPSGRWRWRFTARYPDGRPPITLEEGGHRTRAEALRAGEAVRTALLRGDIAAAAAASTARAGIETLGALVDHYLGPWATAAGKRPASIARDARALRSLLAAVPHRTPIEHVTARQLETWLHDRRTTCALATVHRDLAAVRAMFGRATACGALDDDPSAGLAFPRLPRGEIVHLEPDEAARLLACARDHAAAARAGSTHRCVLALLTLALNTGLRAAELQHLLWRHVDLDARRLTVANTDAHTTKNSRERTIALNPPAHAALLAWRAQLNTDALEILARRRHRDPAWMLPTHDNHVFPARPSARAAISRSTPSAPICDPWLLAKPVAIAAGLPPRKHGLHALRHTFAVALARAGRPLTEISRCLGHQKLAITEVYLRFSPTEGMRAPDSIAFAAPDHIVEITDMIATTDHFADASELVDHAADG